MGYDGDVDSRNLRWFIGKSVAPSQSANAVEALRSTQLRADEKGELLLNATDRSIDRADTSKGSEPANKNSFFVPDNRDCSAPLRGITFAKHCVQMLLQKKIGSIDHSASSGMLLDQHQKTS
jgi:hypothetical protein